MYKAKNYLLTGEKNSIFFYLSNFLGYFPYDQRKDECSLLEKRLHCEPKLIILLGNWQGRNIRSIKCKITVENRMKLQILALIKKSWEIICIDFLIALCYSNV